MLKEAYEAKAQIDVLKDVYDEYRTLIIDAVKGKDDKTLSEGEYIAKVKYIESVEYVNIDEAQKVLPMDCFKVVIDKDMVKALEKAGKLDSKQVDKFRKYSYTTPRVIVDKL